MLKRPLSIALVTNTLLCLSLGCTSAPPQKKAPIAKTQQTVKKTVFVRAEFNKMPAQANVRRQLLKYAENAKGYFTSEQLVKKTEPWHTGKAGMPVRWKEYVFPGGQGFTLVTKKDAKPETPIEFKTKDNPTAQDKAVEAAAVTLLGLKKEQSIWRYSYKTAQGGGNNAVATIRAETLVGKDNYVAYEIKVMIDATTQEVLIKPVMILDKP